MNTAFILTFVKQVAILYPTFILLFTFRGFFQALTARIVGDTTPQENGFLTLNPIAHIEPVGTLLLSLLFASLDKVQGLAGGLVSALLVLAIVFVGVRPYYPVFVDVDNFKWPRLGVVFTTLGVTFSYLVLALLSLYASVWGYYFLGEAPAFLMIQQVSQCIRQWSLFWAVISLIPIPPFEAAALLPVFFGEMGQTVHDTLEQYWIFIFCGIFFLPGISDWVLYGLDVAIFYINQVLIHLVWLPAFAA